MKDYLKPEYEKDRAEIKANTLVNVMLRLDFTPLISAEKVVLFLQDELCSKGFEYREDFLQESEMKLNDPIEKDDRIFPRQIENERVYRFILDGKIFKKIFNFSRFFLIYQVSPFAQNFNYNIEEFSQLIKKTKKIVPYLKIKRLGIRKTNLVIAEDFQQLFKCFREDYLPISAKNKINSRDFGVFESQESFFDRNIQVACNIRKRLDSGEMQISNEKQEVIEEKDVLRFILELEAYSRGDKALTNSEDYVDKLKQMNAGVFFLYLEHLTPTFLGSLKDSITADLLSGVKLNVEV